MTVSEICDWIVLIGAVTIALTNIYNFVIKPKKKLKDRRRKEIEDIIEEKIPELFTSFEEELIVKLQEDREVYAEQKKSEVLEEVKEVMEGIININKTQSENIEILARASKDVLRQRIMDIYHNHVKEKKLPLHKKEALDELYKDYTEQHGNSYITKYYNRMCTWEVLEDEEGQI